MTCLFFAVFLFLFFGIKICNAHYPVGGAPEGIRGIAICNARYPVGGAPKGIRGIAICNSHYSTKWCCMFFN